MGRYRNNCAIRPLGAAPISSSATIIGWPSTTFPLAKTCPHDHSTFPPPPPSALHDADHWLAEVSAPNIRYARVGPFRNIINARLKRKAEKMEWNVSKQSSKLSKRAHAFPPNFLFPITTNLVLSNPPNFSRLWRTRMSLQVTWSSRRGGGPGNETTLWCVVIRFAPPPLSSVCVSVCECRVSNAAHTNTKRLAIHVTSSNGSGTLGFPSG